MASVTLRMAWSMVSPVDTQPGMSGTVTPYWLPRLFWIRMGMSMVLPQRRRGGGAGGAGIVSSVIQDGIDIKHFRGRVRFGVVRRGASGLAWSVLVRLLLEFRRWLSGDGTFTAMCVPTLTMIAGSGWQEKKPELFVKRVYDQTG